jgi:hypothetical protein
LLKYVPAKHGTDLQASSTRDDFASPGDDLPDDGAQ